MFHIYNGLCGVFSILSGIRLTKILINKDETLSCYIYQTNVGILTIMSRIKGEFQICPHMDFDNILYFEYLRYINYKNEIITFLEGC